MTDDAVRTCALQVIRDIAIKAEIDLELVSCVLDPTADDCSSRGLPGQPAP